MGRAAGHLALGIGKSAGATLTIIPEEFRSERISVADVVDVIETAILKRRVMGKERGLAVIAEGVAEKFDPEEIASFPGVEVSYDQHGHIRLGEIQLEKILKRAIQKRFEDRGEAMPIVDSAVGYELRSYAPIPFDIDYTRSLGYGAARALLSEPSERYPESGGLVCLVGGEIRVLPFSQFRDPETGRTRVRVVDVEGQSYLMARRYIDTAGKVRPGRPRYETRTGKSGRYVPRRVRRAVRQSRRTRWRAGLNGNRRLASFFALTPTHSARYRVVCSYIRR